MPLYLTVSTLNPNATCQHIKTYPTYNTDCWNGSHYFTKLQLEQDSSLSGSIKANHEDAHLLATEEAIKQTTNH